MIRTGTKIKYLRQLRKLTMKALGEKLGFDEKNAAVRIAQWERGTRNPSADSMKQLSQALEVDLERLFQNTDDPVSGLIDHIIWSELTERKDLDADFARLAAFIGEFLRRRADCRAGKVTNEDYIEWLLRHHEDVTLFE